MKKIICFERLWVLKGRIRNGIYFLGNSNKHSMLNTYLMKYLIARGFPKSFLESNRNACCPMIRHNKEWKPNQCSQANFIQRAFKSYGKYITTAPFKV